MTLTQIPKEMVKSHIDWDDWQTRDRQAPLADQGGLIPGVLHEVGNCPRVSRHGPLPHELDLSIATHLHGPRAVLS